MKFLFLLVILSSAFAGENMDERLAGYIKEFNLITVRPPEPKERKLVDLGRSLFHEKAISGNQNIRCVDCHHPRLNTQEGIPLSLGEGAFGLEFGLGHRNQGRGKVLARNTPALFNLHNVNVLFWDGRVEYDAETGTLSTPVTLREEVAKTLTSALAAQAIFPMVDHDEMRGQKGTNPIADARDEHEAWELIVERVLEIPEYKKAFAEIFPGERINIGHLGEALAAFQAVAFFSADTPYDRYIQGELEALTPKQKLGMDVFFNKGKCGDCHHGEHLSALDFDGVGVPQIGPGKQNGDDFGRYLVDGDEGSKYQFRVPPLRNVGVTAPYFHNGSMKTLAEVVEHYDDVKASLESYRVAEKIIDQLKNYLVPLKDHDQTTNETRYRNLPEDLPLQLHFTEEEEDALVEFLKVGLTDESLF